MPSMNLDVVDAAELAELLQFLAGWITSDPARLAPSLLAFVGHPAYGLPQLRSDLDRFTFLLGGNDGEPLFQPGPLSALHPTIRPALPITAGNPKTRQAAKHATDEYERSPVRWFRAAFIQSKRRWLMTAIPLSSPLRWWSLAHAGRRDRVLVTPGVPDFCRGCRPC
jgi:hypothetical protein